MAQFLGCPGGFAFGHPPLYIGRRKVPVAVGGVVLRFSGDMTNPPSCLDQLVQQSPGRGGQSSDSRRF
jgi:hypothetical protein